MDRFVVINSPTIREPSKKESVASSNQVKYTNEIDDTSVQSSVSEFKDNNAEDDAHVINVEDATTRDVANVNVGWECKGSAQSVTSNGALVGDTTKASLQLFDVNDIGNLPQARTALMRDSITQSVKF